MAYVDDDAIVTATWVRNVLRVLGDFPNVGVVGGPVIPIWPGDPPGWLHEWQRGFFTIVDLGEGDLVLRPDQWIAGTNMVLRKKVTDGEAPFNPALGRIRGFLLSNEEVSLFAGVRERGWVIVYSSTIPVRHHIDAGRVDPAWLRKRVA